MYDNVDNPNFGHWYNEICEMYRPYVCKGPSSPDNPKPQKPKCDIKGYENFVPFRNECYWQSSGQGLTWNEAEQACLQKGAQLTSILDWLEQSYLFSHFTNSSFWIGLNGLAVNSTSSPADKKYGSTLPTN